MPWRGALLGLGIGVLDAFGFALAGVEVTWDGQPAGWLVYGWFATSMGVLGGAVESLWQARRTSEAQASTIARQLASLQAAQQALLQSEKLAALGRMVAGVAHEVRNPLGVIRSSAALLVEGLDEDSRRSRAGAFIVAEVDRLDALVRQLLDLSRPVRAARIPVDLRAAVDQARALSGLPPDQLQTSALPTVSSDPDLLVQVLQGLLRNALEADEDVRVAVEVQTGDPVELSVVDDGPGIDPAVADRALEPFFTTKAEGTGLGLPMAARLTEALGGQLLVVPGAGLGPGGRGARITLRLHGGDP
jgi:two-component system sensor histidine kinase HydH